MSKISIAAVQLISTPNVADNLRRAAKLIGKATKAGAQIILLPEVFAALIPNSKNSPNIGEKFLDFKNQEKTPIQCFLRDMAIKHQVWLIGGSVEILTNNTKDKRNFNRLIVFNPQGKCIAHYDKIHLFSFQKKIGEQTEKYDENDSFIAGNEIKIISIKINNSNINLCASICYDLRFPELYRKAGAMLAKKNQAIDIILMPAAFTDTTGRAHWKSLLRARAIENQCYVLAAAQGGEHFFQGKVFRKTHGHSMIINPWGKISKSLKYGEGIVMGNFNPKLINELRENLPAIKNRKIDN